MKYRKKPVVIEAMQWDGSYSGKQELNFGSGAIMTKIEEIKERLEKASACGERMFATLEGMEFLWSAKSDIEWLLDTLEYEKSATAEAIRRIGELETTLRYYADSYNYGDGNGLSWESTDIRNDRGKRARWVLGEHDGGL